MNFVHRGIVIDFDQKLGDFSAIVAGQSVSKTSLPAMKKFINANWESTFKPFKALLCNRYGSDPTLEKILVTGVHKSRRRYSDPEWVIDKKDNVKCVAEHSPENIKRVRKYLDMKTKIKKAIEKMQDELEEVKKSIVLLTP